jgi:hypothetical protein
LTFKAIPVRRVEDFSDVDVTDFERRILAMKESVVATRSASLMRQAVTLLDFGGDAFADLALLRLFTAIEGIVSDVVRTERSSLTSGAADDVGQLVDELEDLLEVTRDETKRTQAVRQAVGRIRERNLETMKGQLSAAASVLEIPEGDATAAVELLKIRNGGR